ncbi:MAG: ANTAR domain-containing protein [Actinomycetota bacterium]|nr:ANTAR domain-containing protein [Actinomycetota bacterium]
MSAALLAPPRSTAVRSEVMVKPGPGGAAAGAPLRVLVADGLNLRWNAVTAAIASLGHEAIGKKTTLAEVGSVTASEWPDVALVIVEESSAQALNLIRRITHEATCPVIAILDVEDREFVDQAARLGIFAHIVGGKGLEELQSSIDIALQRFAEYHALQGAFGRRAITERAKGILMERHSIDEERAFNMIRDHSRRTHRKVVDVAEAILSSHRLLASRRTEEPADVPFPESADPEHSFGREG